MAFAGAPRPRRAWRGLAWDQRAVLIDVAIALDIEFSGDNCEDSRSRSRSRSRGSAALTNPVRTLKFAAGARPARWLASPPGRSPGR